MKWNIVQNTTSTFESILSKLSNVQRADDGFSSRCPSHDDHKNSLSLEITSDGIILMKCFAGCEIEAISRSLGITQKDLFPAASPPRKKDRYPGPWLWKEMGLLEDIYDYVDESGVLLFQVLKSNDKEFKQRRPDPKSKGGWNYKLNGTRRVLYRLPELNKRIENGLSVFLVEGEKDCDNVRNLGLCSTTSSGGAGNWNTDYTEVLSKAKEVFIIPDNDPAGKKLAWDVKSLLPNAVVVELPGLPNKGDVSDWIETGGTAEELKLLAAEAQKNPLECPEEFKQNPVKKIDQRKVLTSKAPLPIARMLLKEKFTDKKGRLTIRRYNDQFYRFKGASYERYEDEDLKAVLYAFLDKLFISKKNAYEPFNPKIQDLKEIKSALGALDCLVDRKHSLPVWLGPGYELEPHKVAVLNDGLLDLEIRELYPPNPDFFNVNSLPVSFDKNFGEPLEWLRFLGQLWPNDPESIKCLQEIFGYLLCSDTRQQKIFLICGPRRAGKGIIAKILEKLIGSDNICAPKLSRMDQNFASQTFIEKSLAIFSDARVSGRSDDISVVEDLLTISGNDTVNIHRKHKTDWIGRLGTRFLLFSNEIPQLRDSSGALAGRLIALELKNSFYGKEDLDLIVKLSDEIPGILNWSVDGWGSLENRGYFVQPRSGSELLQDFEGLSSPIAQFVNDRCILHCDNYVSSKALFDSWVSWCDETGIKIQGTTQQLGRNLKAAFPGLGTPKMRKKVRCYLGIALKHEKCRSEKDRDDRDLL
jgi:putative DNA primase/helicase